MSHVGFRLSLLPHGVGASRLKTKPLRAVLHLQGVSGNAARSIYRINTIGGQPPTSVRSCSHSCCKNGSLTAGDSITSVPRDTIRQSASDTRALIVRTFFSSWFVCGAKRTDWEMATLDGQGSSNDFGGDDLFLFFFSFLRAVCSRCRLYFFLFGLS
jgi:hypothetical protein